MIQLAGVNKAFDGKKRVAVLENIDLQIERGELVSLPLHLRGWPGKKIESRARELLELVRLGHRIEHLADELSGGERQRVAIARALAFSPPILLGDEPTGNLDSRTGVEILKLIHECTAGSGPRS